MYSLHLEMMSLESWTRLRQLDRVERAVYVLHQSFSYSHREIACALGLPEPDVRRAFRRALDEVDVARTVSRRSPTGPARA